MGRPVADETPPLNLTVLITSEGFAVKQHSAYATEAVPPIPKRHFTVNGQARLVYDYPALYTHIRQKKKDHPKVTKINVGAEMDIPWQIIARTMDATRAVLSADAYEDLAAYSSAKPMMGPDTNGDGLEDPIAMFPEVTFVVAE